MHLQTSSEKFMLLHIFLIIAKVITSCFGSSELGQTDLLPAGVTSTHIPHIYECFVSHHPQHQVCPSPSLQALVKLCSGAPQEQFRVFGETQVLLSAVFVKGIEMQTTMQLHSLRVLILSTILITRCGVHTLSLSEPS